MRSSSSIQFKIYLVTSLATYHFFNYHLAFSWSGCPPCPFWCRFQWCPSGVATGLARLKLNHKESTEKPMGKAKKPKEELVPVWTCTLSAQIFPSHSNIAGEHSQCQPNYSSHISLLMVLPHSVVCFCRFFFGNKSVEIWLFMYVLITNFHMSLVVPSLVYFLSFCIWFQLFTLKLYQLQRSFNKLVLEDLTRLIKWITLYLTDIVLFL